VLLVAAIATVALLHYSTPITYIWAHPLLERAYYIPILLAALWFGWRGGLAAATLAGVSYIPHIIMAWKFDPEYRDAQYIEIGMFFAIATLTGILADHERAQRCKIEETASRLSEVYTQLQNSFEQLRRADRLSALGELSAGLAHEIRNPLGSIEGAVQILGRRELPEETRQEFTGLASRKLCGSRDCLRIFSNSRALNPRISLRPILDYCSNPWQSWHPKLRRWRKSKFSSSPRPLCLRFRLIRSRSDSSS
jgi:signal transduction histidine kinase